MSTLTSSDGSTIAYEIDGSGPAIVLVDGATCFRDAGPMRPIAAALRERLTVVLYDRRGRGESSDRLADPSARADAVAREIEDLAALVDAVGGSATLFGMSSGGALALAATAALGAERVPRVAVYEPPYLPDSMLPSAEAYTRELAGALAADDRAAAVELFLRRVGVPEAGIEGMRNSPGWESTLALAPTLAYDDAAMGDSRVPDDLLQAVSVPVLALAGEQTPGFLRVGAEGVASGAQDGDFEVVAGQTHDVSGEAVAPHLIRFVTG
ncbi:alpha/beta hydrolase [Leifsonia sp. fls2-241-R2A-40a]|uniref:alpha/beta fold hydrolase n=1 Tax=Leifsonia sp. fls2-241-R2A-40a TaxID=3040290 RepID=UPI00254AB05C|nr:alpha/beta hydrolase [Leifsonia sp. fls2-241-R2A-40a]